MASVKLMDFTPHEETPDVVVEIMATTEGTYTCEWQGESLTFYSLKDLREALSVQAKVKARKIRIDVGTADGTNVVLVGMHANKANVLARALDNAGKLVRTKVDRWAYAYKPWTPALIIERDRLATAVSEAERAHVAFMDSREMKSERGAHITMRDVIQAEIDLPETIAKRLLTGEKA